MTCGREFADVRRRVAGGSGISGAARELPALLVVVLSIEDVPFAAARQHALGHARTYELVEAIVGREGGDQRALGLVEEQAVAAHPSELLVENAPLERVRQERQPALRQVHSTNPRALARRCFTSCSTRRRSRSSRRTPGAPCRTSFSASAIASRSIASSSSKFFVSSATKRARTRSSGTSSWTTSASTRRRTSVSATRVICAADGRMAPN